jgi:tetratricopeptide (TPR) repeat protein
VAGHASRPSFFSRLWAAIKRIFTRSGSGRIVRGIAAAPLTLVSRISAIDDKEREAIKLAEEALRRGYPDQAVVAYWKAADFFIGREHYNKALSMLAAILKIQPDDVRAALERISVCEKLDRKRDAALACVYVAELYESRGQWDEARAIRARSVELDPRLAPPSATGSAGPKLRLQTSAQTSPAAVGAAEVAPSRAVDPAAARARASLLKNSPIEVPDISEPAPAPSPPAAAREEDGAPIELDLERSAAVDRSSIERKPRGAEIADEESEAFTVGMAAMTHRNLLDSTTDEGIAIDPRGDDDAAPTVALPAITSSPEPAERKVRFGIPQASTTADVGVPSSVVGTEHEADARKDLSSRIPNDDTKALSPEQLRELLDKNRTRD